MRSGCVHGLMVAGALWAGAHAGAQAPDTVYHVHGSVVDGVTGKAVGRALVTSVDRRLATLTDSSGNFAIDVSVPAAETSSAGDTAGQANVRGTGRFATGGLESSQMLRLEAQRPGFLPGHDVADVLLTARDTEAAVILRLFPAAVVRGRVDSATETPGRNLTVLLLRRSVSNGRYQWLTVGGRSAGQDGTFAFPELSPGEYTVLTREDSGVAARTTAARSAASDTAVEQYPPTFLGGTSTLATATHLHLRYGQTAQVSLAPRAVPYFSVAVPVKGVPANTPMNVHVSRDGEQFSSFPLRWNAGASQVEGSLPSGDYTLLVNQFGPTHAFATAPLHVAGGPVTLAALALQPTLDIPVRVHDERQASGAASGTVRSPGEGFSLYLRPESQASGLPGGSTQVRNGELVLQNLVAGSYRVEPMGWQGYVAAVTSGGTDLLRAPLAVSETGVVPIDLTLRDDGGTVQGSIAVPEGEAGQYAVILLPTDGSPRALELHTGQTSVTFSMRNVPPGSYRVFARRMSDPMDEIAYREPEAMRVFDGVGVAVQVMPNATAEVTVPVVREEPGR